MLHGLSPKERESHNFISYHIQYLNTLNKIKSILHFHIISKCVNSASFTPVNRLNELLCVMHKSTVGISVRFILNMIKKNTVVLRKIFPVAAGYAFKKKPASPKLGWSL